MYLQSPANPPLLSTLLSKALIPRPSLIVSDQVSDPYKATGKRLVLFVSFFRCLESKRKYARSWTEGQRGPPACIAILIGS